jgi:hypothetical protein
MIATLSKLFVGRCSNKGVKVELGIPYELWDKPSAEVSKMHRAVSCQVQFSPQKTSMSCKLLNTHTHTQVGFMAVSHE